MKKIFLLSLITLIISQTSNIFGQDSKTLKHRIRISYDNGRKMKGEECIARCGHIDATYLNVENEPGNGININYTYYFYDFYKEYPGILAFWLLGDIDYLAGDTISINNYQIGLEVFAAFLDLQFGVGYANFPKTVQYIENKSFEFGKLDGIFAFASMGMEIPLPYKLGFFVRYHYNFYPGELTRTCIQFGLTKKIFKSN